MTTNQLSSRGNTLILTLVCAIGMGALGGISSWAQNTGDWQTANISGNTLVGGGGDWDNSNNNSLGNANTWEMYTNGGWVLENGNQATIGYPSNNTGVITILSGTTITNASASGSGIIADGVVVQSGASLQILNYYFTLAHNGYTNTDLDVFGSLDLECATAQSVSLDSGATIVMESGSTMTNAGATSGDNFTGNGYETTGPTYVPGAITFKSGSTFILAAITNKGTIPHATWDTGSTCMVAPPASNTTNFIPLGLAEQTFYNFIWYWPTENGKSGGSSQGGSFTVNGNFAMTGNANGMVTNEDIPYSGNTLTVIGNIGITNVNWFPTASAGVATIMSGGNFIVADGAVMKINSGSGTGDVIFNGTSGPQTVGFYGPNSLASLGSWNWTVNSGSTVDLDSALTNNGGAPNTGGTFTINGTLNLTANGSLWGTTNVLTVAHNASLNVSQAAGGAAQLSLGDADTLQGAGTITGNVTAGNTSIIHPGGGLPLTFVGSLTYGSATSTNIFNLTSSASGTNDQIVVNGGTLTANNAQIVINPVNGTLASSDYVLFNVTGGGTISSASSFASTVAWSGTPPANSNSYSILVSGTQVLLHYGTVASPRPAFTSIHLSSTNLLINGTNGAAGTYVVLMSTNLASTNWVPVATNVLSGTGSFSVTATNAVNTGSAQQFYILRGP